MPKRSKRYRKGAENIEESGPREVGDALVILDQFPKPKFDETIEFCIRLGIDPKKSDQNVRGAVSLPHGIGKTLRVIAFAEGDNADAAKEAGATEVGSADLAKKIQDGWLDFDVAVATPDMMKHVGRLGKVLGPQGKMPSPKAGTVTPDIGTAVREFAAGKIEFRNDAGGNLHIPVGKRSFDNAKLEDNIRHFASHVSALRPATTKGAFITKATISSTIGPVVTVKV